MDDLQLHDQFTESSRNDWRALAEKGLRGAAFESLTSVTEDGISRGPLFDAGDRPDAHAPLPRSGAPLRDGRAWHMAAPVLDRDNAHANTQLLDDLKGGCSAVYIDGGTTARRADLRRLLEGVHLELVPVIFAPDHPAAAFAADMDELSETPVILGLNPLDEIPDIPKNWRAFTANAAAIHAAGGTDMLELAGFAASVAEAFRRHGTEVHDHMSAHFAVGTDAHLAIAKLRTARRLYARIAGAFGVEHAALPIIASTSLRMMQSTDAWTNMLRTMSAGFGAVVGGADYVITRPFTQTPPERALGGATAFAHRAARNQQIMMMEESHLGQVQDAAYGSYFHERLSEDLAQAAWTKFQSIEALGGIETYRRSGDFKADCDAAARERAARGELILGVTLHPSADVPPPEVRPEPEASS